VLNLYRAPASLPEYPLSSMSAEFIVFVPVVLWSCRLFMEPSVQTNWLIRFLSAQMTVPAVIDSSLFGDRSNGAPFDQNHTLQTSTRLQKMSFPFVHSTGRLVPGSLTTGTVGFTFLLEVFARINHVIRWDSLKKWKAQEGARWHIIICKGYQPHLPKQKSS
jgi:hypothetical protein